jgi:hypothetical protein
VIDGDVEERTIVNDVGEESKLKRRSAKFTFETRSWKGRFLHSRVDKGKSVSVEFVGE